MDVYTSRFLEILRVMAALGVMLSHSTHERFNDVLYLGDGHLFVIIFFILSGYVIAFTVQDKDEDLLNFSSSRLSRFLSVVLPVLILVPVLDYVGQYFNSQVYLSTVQDNYPVLRGVINLFFMQELWFESVRYLSNGPMWSLGYEFWYYFIFAFGFYFNGWKRYATVFLFTVIVGPKIMLLMPIWLLGVLAYKWHCSNKSIEHPTLLFVLSILICIASVKYNELLPFKSIEEYFSNIGFGYSSGFLFDWFFSFWVFSAVLSFKYISSGLLLKFFDLLLLLIKPLARSSFSLYLLHYPVMLFLFSVMGLSVSNIYHWISMVLVTVFLCHFFSKYTEQKRYILKPFLHQMICVSTQKFKKIGV